MLDSSESFDPLIKCDKTSIVIHSIAVEDSFFQNNDYGGENKLKIVFFQFMGKLAYSHMQDINIQHHNDIILSNGPAVCFCIVSSCCLL